jgi:cytochrome P450
VSQRDGSHIDEPAYALPARDPETGYAYTDQEIRDELMTFIGAGMETPPPP